MTVPLPSIPTDEGPALPDPAEAPVPTGQYAGWFPAMLDIPGLQRMTRVRCYVTPEGLYAWTRAPRATAGDQPPPDVWLPIRWDLTGPMPKGAQARIQGVYLATEYGMIHITPSGGCGCGSRLRQWAPSWASHSLAGWPGQAGETTDVPEQTADELDPPDVAADTDPAGLDDAEPSS